MITRPSALSPCTASIASTALVIFCTALVLSGHPVIAQNAEPEASKAEAATTYKLDLAHTSVVFRISHLGMSHTWGRFNEVGGDFAFESSNLAGSHLKFAVKAASIDTNNKKRDDHLRSPDYFNAGQYPLITFHSTSIAVSDTSSSDAASNEATVDTYVVHGELALHGVTQPITLTLTRLGEGKDPWGNQRIGFATQFTIKRSDFGMDKMLEAVGDDVELFVSFEGTR